MFVLTRILADSLDQVNWRDASLAFRLRDPVLKFVVISTCMRWSPAFVRIGFSSANKTQSIILVCIATRSSGGSGILRHFGDMGLGVS